MATSDNTGADAPGQTPDRAQLEEMLRESFKGRPVEDVWRDIRQIFLNRVIKKAQASLGDENPFICQDDPQTTIFRVHQALTIFERILNTQPDSTGNLMLTLDCNEVSGLQYLLQGIRDALLEAAEALTGPERFDEDDAALCKDFAQLSAEQQATITDLMDDIIVGKDGPGAVDVSAARLVLARFDAAVNDLSAEECAEELKQKYIFDVNFEMTPEIPGDDVYCVAKKWSLKGLRRALAIEKFHEAITFDLEGADG